MADEGGSKMSNVKRGVTTAFSRARQFTEERLGQVEKTEYDQNFENLLSRADRAKMWTERLVRQTEVVVRPSPNERLENFVYTKLDRQAPVRNTPIETLGQQMLNAGMDFGDDSPLGCALVKCGQTQKELGAVQKEFVGTTVTKFVHPMKKFLDEEMKTITKERTMLNRKRLDLDAAKAKQKRTKSTERMQAVDQEVRHAKDGFERQFEVTKILLEGLSNSQMSQLRYLQEFVEAQEAYHQKCAEMLQKLTDDIRSAFTVASAPPLEEDGDALLDSRAFSSAPVTRRAKVLYDYDAQNSSELSLLAEEVIIVYNVPGLDSDYMMGERGSEKGKVPTAFIELV